LVWAAHELGINASLAVVDLPDIWYRVPLLLLEAAQNGILEEIVVIGYLLTRLRQLGWSDSRALAASAVLRGSYHLYQGLGGFLGNMVMGIIFGWWFQRTRRVLPLAVAHTRHRRGQLHRLRVPARFHQVAVTGIFVTTRAPARRPGSRASCSSDSAHSQARPGP
jgi:F420-0:gamma-glutamyl ligase-like protein